MIFDRLAGFIARRHRILILVWILALAACIPLFSAASSVTTSQQTSTTSTGDSAVAQSVIDRYFSTSTSGGTLFLVITSSNVTTPSVKSFVGAIVNASKTDAQLSNLTGVGSVYKSVRRIVDGAASAIVSYRSGVQQATSLVYGVPAAFLAVWNSTGDDPLQIPEAQAQTFAILSASTTNATQLAVAQQYLRGFASTLSASYQSQPSLSLPARIDDAIGLEAGQFAANLPPSQVGFGSVITGVQRSFTLGNYSDAEAIGNFTVVGVSKVSLYSPGFLAAVYPVAVTRSPAAESRLVDAIVVNPSVYDVPEFYLNAVTGYVGQDHRVMLVTLSFKGVTASDVRAVRDLVKQFAPDYGLEGAVGVTGSEALDADFSASSFKDLGLILPITIIILIGATGIFFRSVVSPAVTLAAIGIALGVADSLVIYVVGTFFVGVDPNVPNILLSVMIGVGTDYSVFLLARYREERVRGADKITAVTKSVTWAGESIATSGLTVIISFALLGVGQSVSLLRSLGLVVGAGVLVALAASLTLVPSLILTMPNTVFWPNVGSRFARYAAEVERSIENKTGYFSKSAKFSIRHAKAVTVVALVATAPAVYIWSQAPVGYDFLAAAPSNLESVAAFNNMSSSFGAGTLYPTYAVLQFKTPLWNGTGYNMAELKVVDSLANLTLAQHNVKSVTGPTRPNGDRIDYLGLGNDTRSRLIEGSINKLISPDGIYALVSIDFQSSPQGQTSLDTAQSLRNEYASLVRSNPEYLSAVYLGGAAGSTLDTKDSVGSQFNLVILYVMLGVAAVLLVVLGSLFLPLFAIVSIVMSIAWTIAATDIVFQGLFNFPILFITPLTLFVLLLGLGMDYNIFILTRIREEATKGAPLKEAITTAIERTGGIITAAAVILAGSLGALMISNNLLLKEFGFAFFYSILIDAMIMRTYVVPAVMSLMGKWNWYAPGRLQRVRQDT